MAQVHIVGRVTADLEPRTGQSGTPYIRFGIAETVGHGHTVKTQYADVWAWGRLAEQLLRRKVKKGSLIRVSGQLELEEFTKRDGVTTDKRLKVKMESWDYADPGNHQDVAPDSDTRQAEKPKSPSTVIDGERDSLPE